MAPSEALPRLAAVLVKTDDDGFRNEAADALVNIANRDQDIESRSEPILKRIGSASGPAKFSLLVRVGPDRRAEVAGVPARRPSRTATRRSRTRRSAR